MTRADITFGAATSAGMKELNQDAIGQSIAVGHQFAMKGAAFVVADGISSSPYSHEASKTAVKSFLHEYFCTSDAWTVERAGQCVFQSINSWLYSQGQHTVYKYEKDKGYVCTLSALVVKGQSAHIFHVGDTRIYRMRRTSCTSASNSLEKSVLQQSVLEQAALEQITTDHRLWQTETVSFLSRAMGVEAHVDIDYKMLTLHAGDIYILASDGLYEYVSPQCILNVVATHIDNLQYAADHLIVQALERGSGDNLSLQIVHLKSLPEPISHPVYEQSRALGRELECPRVLEPGMEFDGFKILSTLQLTSRSHVFLALDLPTQQKVILKVPSEDMRDNADYLERFIREEWISRRINSPYVVKTVELDRPRQYLYTLTEFIEGRTLRQWLVDHPAPELETVRKIVEQIAKGLMEFHRRDMLHQDLKLENIMIDAYGMIKIIDFGAVYVAGLEEAYADGVQPPVPGAAMFAAPEYFLGERGSTQSDLFSLAVITYHLLSGAYPYGAAVAKTRTVAEQRRLQYASVLHDERNIPSWIDACLKRALQPSPYKRYSEISEFLYDLRQPSSEFLAQSRPPLIQRSPVKFWQAVSFMLFIILIIQAALP
ncbi:Serine/threonine-protein kinase PrkC [Thalassocella blandensis]|nr:Serine/threonine-protein kinase PrkC [Thalassocella blandensis]